MRVASIERSGTGESLRVEVTNQGSRHALLAGARLLLLREPGAEPAIELDSNELPGLVGENMLAGSVRVFTVPAPENLWDGPLYAEIEVDEE